MGAGTDINLEKSDQIRNQGSNNSERTDDFGQWTMVHLDWT